MSTRAPELVVALDFPTAHEGLDLARRLTGTVAWVKVGMEMFTAEGPPVIRALKDLGFRVFLDLKFHDIPNTVKGAARSAAGLGVDIVTLHHAGGRRMAEAALEGVREAGYPTLPFAVTLLTSISPQEAGLSGPEQVVEAVAAKAVEARSWGLPGIVCSGNEVGAVKAVCGPDLLCLCPGIRLAGRDDDQRRIVTPGEAVRNGADFLVVGRPVTRDENPVAAATAILQDMVPNQPTTRCDHA